MEEARYWMWAKPKPDPNPPAPAPAPVMLPYGDSWEEQAFAEDAAGTLGGCVWPPRSYSCSFCRREFKSAQALGGHMNVHRRDRARLKQSSNSPTDHLLVVPQSTSFDAPYSSSKITTFLYNNPNPNPNPIPSSWSSFLSDKRDLDVEPNEKKRRRGVDPESRAEKDDCVTEIDVGFVVFNDQTRTKESSNEEEVASRKRRRIEAPEGVEVLKVMCPVEELDLELRLGNAPKVK